MCECVCACVRARVCALVCACVLVCLCACVRACAMRTKLTVFLLQEGASVALPLAIKNLWRSGTQSLELTDLQIKFAKLSEEFRVMTRYWEETQRIVVNPIDTASPNLAKFEAQILSQEVKSCVNFQPAKFESSQVIDDQGAMCDSKLIAEYLELAKRNQKQIDSFESKLKNLRTELKASSVHPEALSSFKDQLETLDARILNAVSSEIEQDALAYKEELSGVKKELKAAQAVLSQLSSVSLDVESAHVKDKKDQATKVTESLDTLERDLKAIKTDLELSKTVQAQMISFKDDFETVKQELNTARALAESIHTSSILEDIGNLKAASRKNATDTVEMKSVLKGIFSDLKELVHFPKQEFEAAKADLKEFASLPDQILHLKQELQDLNAINKQLKGSLANTSELKGEFKAALDELKADNGRFPHLAEKLRQLQADFEFVKTQLNADYLDEKCINAFAVELAFLKSKEESGPERKIFEQLDILKAEMAIAKAEITNSATGSSNELQLASFKSKLAQFKDEMKSENAELVQNGLDNFGNEIANLKAVLDKVNPEMKKIGDLQEKITTLDKQVEETRNQEQSIQSIQLELKKIKETLHERNISEIELESINSELKKSAVTAELLEVVRVDLQTLKSKFKTGIVDSKQVFELNLLKAAIEKESKANSAAVSKQLDTFQIEVDAIKVKLQTSKADLEQLDSIKAVMESAESRMKEFGNMSLLSENEMIRKLEALKAELNIDIRMARMGTEQWSNLSHESEALRTEQLSELKKVRSFEVVLDNLQNKLVSVTAELKAVQGGADQLEALKKEVGSIQTNLKRMESETSTTSSAAAQLDFLISDIAAVKAEQALATTRLKATEAKASDFAANSAETAALRTEMAAVLAAAGHLESQSGKLAEMINELQQFAADAVATNLTTQRATIVSAVDEKIAAATSRLESRLDAHQASHGSYTDRSALGAAADGGDGDDAPAPAALAVAVRAVLREVYENRTRGVDWLLSANGARIVKSSPTYVVGGRRWFSRPRRAGPGTGPEALLRVSLEPAAAAVAAAAHGSGGVDPGQCWAMAGAHGWVTVRLARTVTPSRLVLQHIPARVSLNACRSAPRIFRLVGLLSPAQDPGAPSADTAALASAPTWGGAGGEREVELVRGEYAVDPAAAGPAGGDLDEINTHLQSFEIRLAGPVRVDRVKLYIEDNHGEPHFTCLYHPVLYGDP